MKTKFALLFGISFAVLACKKEDPTMKEEDTSGNQTDNHQLENTPGSYWIYEWIAIDSNGIETPTGNVDSVYCVADSAMNSSGYTAYISENVNNSNSYPIFLKDDNGVIKNENDKILYSYTNFSTVIATGNEPGFWDWSLKMHAEKTASVPAGTFGCIEARTTYTGENGGPATNCGTSSFSLGRWYAPNVGLVRERTGYFSQLQQCAGYLEKRLLRYHLQ
ncbi:MAG: hypothetical protein N4A41_02540 [Crocinitomicaceae bacterium]|jgi:hypothetical protein|nr:hypothetical protein [Crocinitomicaceae bacterium]